MDTLKIFIKGKWLDQIAKKEKTIEYRDVKPFWNTRLYDKDGKRIAYKYIEFINGMKPNARRLITEYLGFSKRGNQYQIKIGRILSRRNFKR